MADWIFQASAHEHDLDASIAAPPERWWGTPRYRDRIAVGDRVWLQMTGPHHPCINYVATIVSAVYEHLCVPKTYATWADVPYLAVGSGAASGTWAAGRAAPTPVEDATILSLWA